ncbi:hypothetical protein JZ751_003579 [Albula glossodonta]|uniref:Uncharacterized protein n=1 Tax=Albula glossodonta TaxID=121402 RepID=A0A8T2MVV6_9TELE|nr:hypothetical protein JZ751_003579 [Albula glossodonta]
MALWFCSGKLVSPKWKNFKGLKLLWRDKIRLNNAIWRAWYMQCKCPLHGSVQNYKTQNPLHRLHVEKRENPVCHFVTPLDGTISSEDHRPAEVTCLTLSCTPAQKDPLHPAHIISVTPYTPSLPAITTEGKYWKRRIEIVIREYHKWRTYFKKRYLSCKPSALTLQHPASFPSH